MELFKAVPIMQSYREMSRYINFGNRKKSLPVLNALGLKAFHNIRADENVPGFSRSTMDGFAVRAADTFGASDGLPAYLDVVGEVLMGQEVQGSIRQPGQAWSIPTGGMLPGGCDAVVMVEYTEELDVKTIGVTRPVAPGENIVQRGEDISPGEIIVPQGQIIRPQELGVLAAAGITSVDVEEPVRVAIISTGDEVVNPLENPGPGQIRDINSYTLYGLVRQAGGYPVLRGIIKDDYNELREVMEDEMVRSDIILLSGGSSVGTRDLSAKVITSLGGPGILFHGISIKPGKPTIGAVVGEKPVFGLPGHPVSAMVVFLLLVDPLIRCREYPLEEEGLLMRFPVTAKITRNLRSAAGREDYVRVALRQQDGQLLADPILGRSGLIATMARADGLARIPPELEGIEAGDPVRVKMLC